jgi:hypothetical protein
MTKDSENEISSKVKNVSEAAKDIEDVHTLLKKEANETRTILKLKNQARIHEGAKESIQQEINDKLVNTKDKLTTLMETARDQITDVEHDLRMKKAALENDMSALRDAEKLLADTQTKVMKSKDVIDELDCESIRLKWPVQVLVDFGKGADVGEGDMTMIVEACTAEDEN